MGMAHAILLVANVRCSLGYQGREGDMYKVYIIPIMTGYVANQDFDKDLENYLNYWRDKGWTLNNMQLLQMGAVSSLLVVLVHK
jgi:hypothetical protein